MKQMESMMGDMFAARIPDEGEYWNEKDGLIYCKKCETPRQRQLVLKGKVQVLPSWCQCQREEHDKEEAEHQEREHLAKVAALKTGMQDRALLEYTFENDMWFNPEIERAKAYVEQWEIMRKQGLGLVIWGGVGTGKTFIAGSIANALIEKEVSVWMSTVGYLLKRLSRLRWEARGEFLEHLNQYALLVIDDLDAERNTSYALEQLYQIIDNRYRRKLPLIVTTNLTLEEMKHPADMSRERIYSRVLGRCVPLKINNRNIREVEAAENMKLARQILVPEQI